MTYKIGKNKYDNWKIFKESNDNHTFFHLRSFPSCYVIFDGKDPSHDDIIKGAQLCKGHTKFRNIPNIYVEYCECGNLLKTTKIGEVEYKSKRKVNKIQL